MDPTLERLLSRVSNALRHLPGATELYLFGSAAAPDRADAWSDLDLQVVTDRYGLNQEYWPRILSLAGEIALAYPISAAPLSASFTIAFAAESPYHKVDIGLSDQREEGGFFSQVQSKQRLWQQFPAEPSAHVFPPAGQAYSPVLGSAAHFMLGEVLGAIRYVKARKRRQHLTCWRFLSAKLNARLRCEVWDTNLQSFPQYPLTTWQFAELDRRLPEPERLELLAATRVADPSEMDASLVDLTSRIVQVVQPSLGSDDAPAVAIAQQYLEFIAHELKRIQP